MSEEQPVTQNGTEEAERLAVLMILREDQLKLLKRLSDLERRVKKLEETRKEAPRCRTRSR